MTRRIKAPGVPIWERGMNEEQLEVIRHVDGPLLVNAGAGSGKTRALVHRIVRLVEEVGVPPHEILAVTFSTKAAGEMNERLIKLGVTSARVGTWHSFCLQILRDDQTEWSTWEVDDKEKFKFCVKEALGYKYLNWQQADLGKVLAFIGICKANLNGYDSPGAAELAQKTFGYSAPKALEAYKTAQGLIEDQGLLTFDDFLMFTHRHLAGSEDARLRWASKYSYLLQDEGQDANVAQVTIAEMLASTHRNYMMVGDWRQSIYGFRGGKPDLFLEFAAKWDAKIVEMNRNYRSVAPIVQAGNAIIRSATIAQAVDMVAEREDKGEIQVLAAANFDVEAEHFAAWVEELVQNGASYADVTALFRTNAQSRALEEALLSRKIPYVVVGGTSFYERREVKDLLAYLRVARKTGDRQHEDVKRCINSPFRYLGSAFVERMMDQAEAKTITDWVECVREVAEGAGIQSRQAASAYDWGRLIEQIRAQAESTGDQAAQARPASILAYVLRQTRYIEWITKDQGEESIHASHAANVRELLRVAERFYAVDELLDFIAENLKAAKRQRSDRQAGGERVLLMSIHRSKGLEWPNLFVCGMNEQILPHAYGDLEEERRLAYVAVTRARDRCILSHVLEFCASTGIKQASPSRFLLDTGLMTAETAPEPTVVRATGPEVAGRMVFE